jgi:hypothetical protein
VASRPTTTSMPGDGRRERAPRTRASLGAVLWFTVWALLVVGTLVGAWFLGRRVYRSGKALAHELERAAEVLAQVSQRADELAAAAAERSVPAPVELVDPAPARARREVTAAVARRRRDARAARHERVYERWLSFSR